ncbi:hypothetical protein Poli38472_001297 [Pythium oligandrum]|uniref:Uncharacterized protein n=1 Tax=Pythium oligandrum TaxID=41045 RepID=A0A8K1CSP7_PYTOL|nr:hypothetical protein Poli38472_001297 [Pythium oligandrum]|eukprot:TMW69141.1 hypothetical protein Poli38472_001297 [Pythium oligandrum]
MNVEYLRLDIPEEATLHLPLGLSISKCHEVVVQCASHDQGWADEDREYDGGEVARTTVCPNVRVVDSSRHHVRYFRTPSDVLDHVTPGNSLQLMLRSQYPGWSNTADYGRLRVQFFVELDEEFVFLSPTEIVLALPSKPIQR